MQLMDVSWFYLQISIKYSITAAIYGKIVTIDYSTVKTRYRKKRANTFFGGFLFTVPVPWNLYRELLAQTL